MYFLLNMGIFQPTRLVYWRVSENPHYLKIQSPFDQVLLKNCHCQNYLGRRETEVSKVDAVSVVSAGFGERGLCL